MKVEEKVITRLEGLIEQAKQITTPEDGGSLNATAWDECEAWLPAAANLVAQILPNESNPYRVRVDQALSPVDEEDGTAWVDRRVTTVRHILAHLITDIRGGTLGNLLDQAQAEVFDDFLQLGEHYLHEGKIAQAGVVISAVFEDSAKKIASKHGIELKKQTAKGKIVSLSTDELINALKAKRALTSPKANAARQAAGLRNAALHADWGDFDVHDVNAALAFTKTWIRDELDG